MQRGMEIEAIPIQYSRLKEIISEAFQAFDNSQKLLKVSATLKIAIFPYLRFQRFQIDMLESFLLKQKSEENIISVERYRG